MITNLLPYIPFVGLLSVVSGVVAAVLPFDIRLSLPLIALGILLVLVAPYRLWLDDQSSLTSQRQQLDDVKDARAQLRVTPRNAGDGFWLEVINMGEQAELEAQIELLVMPGFQGDVRPTNPYTGYWEAAASDRSALKQGFKDKLCIGTTKLLYPQASLQGFFFNRMTKQLAHFETQSFLFGMGKELDAQTLRPAFAIRVVISATPKMAGGPFVQSYLIRGGEGESTLTETTP